MKYQIKMMSNDVFEISEDTFHKLAGQTGLIHIKELDCIINLNSVTSIIPLEKVVKTRVQLHDGMIAIKKFGEWVCENNPSVKINLFYYPELQDEKTRIESVDENISKRLESGCQTNYIKQPSNGLEPVVFKPSK